MRRPVSLPVLRRWELQLVVPLANISPDDRNDTLARVMLRSAALPGAICACQAIQQLQISSDHACPQVAEVVQSLASQGINSAGGHSGVLLLPESLRTSAGRLPAFHMQPCLAPGQVAAYYKGCAPRRLLHAGEHPGVIFGVNC